MTPRHLSTLSDWKIVLAFGALVLALLYGASLASGQFGHIGPDGDDSMRLVQIKAFLSGQGWFDVSQPRLGLEGGTEMHWSRLVDAPILALYSLFHLFLPADAALSLAIGIWPPLVSLLVLVGLALGARQLGNRTTLVFTLIIAAILLARHQVMKPGAIDHHNLQLACLALALGALLSTARLPGRYALGGLAIGLSIAIGAEIYALVAILCAFVAIDWAITGTAARAGTQAFGLAFAATLAAAFVTTIAPGAYAAARCDALSLIQVSAGAAGGLGLALVAATLSGRSVPVRLAALAGLGAGCLLLLRLQAPECLANPLGTLPPIVQDLWLANVDEARPLLAPRADMAAEIPYRIATALLALGICGWNLCRGQRRRAHALLAAMLVTAILLSLMQARFFVYAQLFSVLPLSAWVASLFVPRSDDAPRGTGYIAALAASLPLVWGVPGLLLAPSPSANATPARTVTDSACLGPATLSALNALPQGTVLTIADFAPDLLLNTRHRALHGHYHRNASGIEAALRIYTSAPSDAPALLADFGVDYVLVCPGAAETRALSRAAPGGFLSALAEGRAVTGLQPVPVPSSGALLLRTTHPARTPQS